MRFMMLVVLPQGHSSEQGQTPSAQLVEAMTKYNQELENAGVLLALDGLHPSSRGARVRFKGDKVTVTDGPFAEAKEVVGGFWIIDVRSKEEAIEWAKRIPGGPEHSGDPEGVVEIRQVYELEDFPEDVQRAAQTQ